MPNFTEEDERIAAREHHMNVQANKMYELLKRISDDSLTEEYTDSIELFQCEGGIDGREWMRQVKILLKEIDKE